MPFSFLFLQDAFVILLRVFLLNLFSYVRTWIRIANFYKNLLIINVEQRF